MGKRIFTCVGKKKEKKKKKKKENHFSVLSQRTFKMFFFLFMVSKILINTPTLN